MLKVDRLTNALVKELQGWNEDLNVRVERYTNYNDVIINENLIISVFETNYDFLGAYYNPEELSVLVEHILDSNFLQSNF